MGSNQAGVIGLKTLKKLGHDIAAVSAYDKLVETNAAELGLKVLAPMRNEFFERIPEALDLIVSVNVDDLVPMYIYAMVHYGGITVRPCIYDRKKAGIIVRRMVKETAENIISSKVEEGEVLTEIPVDIANAQDNIEKAYSALYPYYPEALKVVIEKLEEA